MTKLVVLLRIAGRSGPQRLGPQRPGPESKTLNCRGALPSLAVAGGHEVEVPAQHRVELAGAPAAIHVAYQRRGLAAVAAHDRVRLLPAGQCVGKRKAELVGG